MDKNKDLLIELICNEQTHMIQKNHENYTSEKYYMLELLKLKIKSMEFTDLDMESIINEFCEKGGENA